MFPFAFLIVPYDAFLIFLDLLLNFTLQQCGDVILLKQLMQLLPDDPHY